VIQSFANLLAQSSQRPFTFISIPLAAKRFNMANYPSLHHVLSSAPPSPAIPDPVPENIAEDPAYDPSLTSPSAQSTAAQLSSVREVSMVEHGIERVGIRFSPSLQMQRIEWALDVLRKEGVRSVLDVGCGEGDLLRVLCEPAATVPEDPIRTVHERNGNSQVGGDDEEDMEKGDEDHNHNRRETRELFLHVRSAFSYELVGSATA
jgi:hypothetical protein